MSAEMIPALLVTAEVLERSSAVAYALKVFWAVVAVTIIVTVIAALRADNED